VRAPALRELSPELATAVRIGRHESPAALLKHAAALRGRRVLMLKAAHADCNNWKNGRLMEELH